MAPRVQTRSFRENGEKQQEPLRVGPGDGAPGQAEARRRHERLDLNEQRTGALDRRDDDAPCDPATALLEEDLRGVLHLAQTVIPHLEHAHFVRRSEAVLRGPQDPEGVEALALEIEDRVDDVLQNARARDRALLGHMSDEEDRDIVAFRELEKARGALAKLRDAAGRRRDRVGVHRLDRIDDHEDRTHAADGFDDRSEVGFR